MRNVIVSILIAVSPVIAAGEIVFHESTVGPGYAATSVNTPVFRAQSLTSNDSLQVCSYYAPDSNVILAYRTLPSGTWTLYDSGLKGDVTDGHKSISVLLDRRGDLHLAYNHHGDTLQYYVFKEFPLQPAVRRCMVGDTEHDVTYPEFHELPSGNIIFAYRAGHSGGGNLVMNRYDIASGRWSRLHDNLLDGEGERNAYWQMCVTPGGDLQLSWTWRETWMVETNHDICYAVSRDGGYTWMNSEGKPYALPINAKTAELAWHVPQSSELINQTSMTVGASGEPVIASYWREQGDSVPQYRLVWHEDSVWRSEAISSRTEPFSLSGGGTKMIPIARPKVVSWDDKFLILTRDLTCDGRVEAYIGMPGGDWCIVPLSSDSVNAWEPSIDQQRLARDGVLDVFVQTTYQGDGEKVTEAVPTAVRVVTVF